MSLLSDFIVNNLFAFILIFTRLGSALMIMPGIGDSFVSTKIRLLFALALSFVVTPVLSSFMPPPPAIAMAFMLLIISEAIIGIFIGTVMRILIGALDTAGMIFSLQSGFANARMFNPVSGGQGSLAGALFSTLGVVMILATNMHHLLITTIFKSYHMFPTTNGILDTGSMAQVIVNMVSVAFKIGVQFAAPFIIVGLLVYTGFGLLGRLLPQIQVFFLALPLQILLSLITLSFTISIAILFWLEKYEEIIKSVFPI